MILEADGLDSICFHLLGSAVVVQCLFSFAGAFTTGDLYLGLWTFVGVTISDRLPLHRCSSCCSGCGSPALIILILRHSGLATVEDYFVFLPIAEQMEGELATEVCSTRLAPFLLGSDLIRSGNGVQFGMMRRGAATGVYDLRSLMVGSKFYFDIEVWSAGAEFLRPALGNDS